MISPGQKLPLQTALAGFGLLRASSHLPFKHWGSVFSFLWKTSGLLLQAQMAEITITQSNFRVAKGCPQTNLPGQTGQLGLGLW